MHHRPRRGALFTSPILRLPEAGSFLDRLPVLAALWQDRSPAADVLAETLLTGLFFDLCLSGAVTVRPQSALDKRLHRALAYMREHFKRDLTVGDIASAVGLSAVHLRRLFREQIGEGPLETLTSLRLEQACRLLEGSSEHVGHIALQCGFNSADYFCRRFKAVYRRTPTEYRQGDSLGSGLR
jgi:AraC-like DNA-binding protein